METEPLQAGELIRDPRAEDTNLYVLDFLVILQLLTIPLSLLRILATHNPFGRFDNFATWSYYWTTRPREELPEGQYFGRRIISFGTGEAPRAGAILPGLVNMAARQQRLVAFDNTNSWGWVGLVTIGRRPVTTSMPPGVSPFYE